MPQKYLPIISRRKKNNFRKGKRREKILKETSKGMKNLKTQLKKLSQV